MLTHQHELLVVFSWCCLQILQHHPAHFRKGIFYPLNRLAAARTTVSIILGSAV